jgi:lysozyme family protein
MGLLLSCVNWNACLAFVLASEGGYVDDPQDPGGATNLGITLAVLSQWRHTAVTKADVQALGPAEAGAIYRANYWNATRCPDLPSGVDLLVFDAAVNTGCGRSAKFLQGAAGAVADGAIGPATLAAVATVPVGTLIPALASARMAYYHSLSTFNHFGAGWTARVQKAVALADTLAGIG